jgi:hypothetical protein
MLISRQKGGPQQKGNEQGESAQRQEQVAQVPHENDCDAHHGYDALNQAIAVGVRLSDAGGARLRQHLAEQSHMRPDDPAPEDGPSAQPTPLSVQQQHQSCAPRQPTPSCPGNFSGLGLVGWITAAE